MKLLFLIAALLGGCAPETSQQSPAAVEIPTLSPQARALIAPVAESIADEQARQAALPPPVDDRERLERMGRLDQVGRRVWNTIDLSGLPVGERQRADAAIGLSIQAVDRAAFLIVQHGNLDLWQRFVPVLEPLVAIGEVRGESYGLMYDRLAINEGRPQRYGTQMTCKAGKWVIDHANLEDPEHADERRAAMGFRWTLADYEALFADYPPCT